MFASLLVPRKVKSRQEINKEWCSWQILKFSKKKGQFAIFLMECKRSGHCLHPIGHLKNRKKKKSNMAVFSNGKGYRLIFKANWHATPSPRLIMSYETRLHFHTSIRRIFSSAIPILLQFSFPVINGRIEFVSNQQAKITGPKIMRAFCYLSNVCCPDVRRKKRNLHHSSQSHLPPSI